MPLPWGSCYEISQGPAVTPYPGPQTKDLRIPHTVYAASPLALLRVCGACAETRPEVWTISASKACSQFLLSKADLGALTSVELSTAGESVFAIFCF